MAAQWPLVVAQLVSVLPVLPGWAAVSVFDGPPVSSDVPSDYATVGYVADSNLSQHAGTYTSAQEPSGFRWLETGFVASQLTCMSGRTDIALVRVRAFALTDALEAFVRADRRLGGVLSQDGTSEFAVDVLSVQNPQGAAQSLLLTVHYTTAT